MQKRAPDILYFLLSVGLLIAAAAWNGFPLLYSDTGTYIASGFEFQPPVDRPITYGIFLFLTSLGGVSLWLTIIFQSAILAWLMLELTRHFVKEKTALVNVAIIAVLALTTGLSTVASEVIADVFTPILVLSFLLLILDPHMGKWKRSALYFLVFFSSATHISHFLIAISFVFLLAARKIILKKRMELSWKRVFVLLFVIVLSFPLLSTSVTKSSHVFLMGRLAESGTLQQYLHDSCASKHFALCDCKDVIPESADDVIWQKNNSALAQAGGWQGSKTEMNRIIHDIFTTPHYLFLQMKSSMKELGRQLFTYGSGEGLVAYADSIPMRVALKKYFPSGHEHYLHSKQREGKMDKPVAFNLLSDIAVKLSLVILAISFYLQRRNKLFIRVSLFLLAGYFLNCFICSSLVTVANRFGCRLIWMIPFLCLLLLAQWLEQRKIKSNA
ncbi:MAG TPA: hypothetical protein VL651_05925 [Bacteroidia bacterium]|nr:hypothetical protein [Bacteroidia bacterium]